VGPRGLLQPIADGLKFLLKEDITPAGADRPIFMLAPMIIFVVSLIGFAVIPWGGRITFANGNSVILQVASLDVGLLYLLAVASLGVYGVALGGWASNNKYSFFGGMRAAAQMLSYEIPLGLGILVVVLTSGELRLEHIVAGQQAGAWNLLLHPLAFGMVVVGALAESNRMPFDLAEAEQELVGGYHTEYSSMKFALFFLAEYAHMITSSALLVALFLGGWELVPFGWWLALHVPGLGWLGWINDSTHWSAGLVRLGMVYGKICAFIFLYMWVRWTLPRFRYDQLMRLAWRALVPMGLGLVILVGVLVYLDRAISFWAPLGNLVVVLLVWRMLSLRPVRVTGRQAGLPAV